MNKKQFFPMLVVLPFLFCGCSKGPERADAKVAKIGVIVPLTGAAAEIGTSLQNGLLLGAEKVNSQARSYPLELIFEDTGGQVKNALSAYKRLEQEGVTIFYTLMSSHAMAIKPLVERKQGEQLLFANASLPSITKDCENIIRHANVGQHDAEALMKGLNAYRRIAIVTLNDEWAVGTTEIMSEKLKEAGIESYTANFNPDQAKNEAVLVKLLAHKPDAFLLVSYGEFLGQDIKSLRLLGYPGPIYTAAGWAVTRPAASAVAGDYAQGLYYVDFRRNEAFDKLYKERYGTQPAAFSYMAFTDLELLSHVLEREDKGHFLAAKIKALKNFTGTYEQLKIYPNGDIPARTFLNQES
jgi:branched-chain amino acid transport system substrate-binding protein